MLRPVIAAIVRATASMSALTKFSVTGSRDARERCACVCCAKPGPLVAIAQARTRAVVFLFILSDRDDRARAAASPDDVQQVRERFLALGRRGGGAGEMQSRADPLAGAVQLQRPFERVQLQGRGRAAGNADAIAAHGPQGR